ncbi:DUF547 domain-containing protein [Polaribacter aquimarinus]|uniref:DUF547 domain-containing protein n=1 Tax=Polaribacter aquimarinus TaxID=2100726 RepID=A0A2U2JES5_9FLAO|nr:DUF547 domain-containing protein [Polaribacter aquimarinus]PWG06836.1 DUF547 domain-containing protein [Polaribacter aquimarinus]
MKKILLLLIAILTFSLGYAQTSVFNDLLQKHVSDSGIVDYKSFKADQTKLDTYISYLEKTTPENSWSNNKKRAFWINAYNAYTIKLILENYPLKSIMDIKQKGKTAWKIPFANVGGKTYTLDHIEHEILRKKLFDPKIHVGVNCASGSCPKLGNVAFTEDNIDGELTKLMKAFVNDTTRNKITKKKVQISEIFNWFKGDFTKNGSVIDYLNKYSNTEIKSNAKISYLKYDWSLNGK